APYFAVGFFRALILLGIDSAFSITESTLASIVDKTGWSKNWTLVILSLLGLGVGLIYCCQGGLNWLGVFDDYINGTWGITLTALAEGLVLGWLIRLRRLREHANERSDWRLGVWWDFSMRIIIPVVMAALFAWNLLDEFGNPYYLRDAGGGLNIGNIAGLAVMAAAPVLAVVITSINFKKTHDEPIRPEYLIKTPHGRVYGIVAVMLSLDGLFFLALAFLRLISILHIQKYHMGDAGAVAAKAALAGVLLLKGGSFCLIATVIAGVGMVWYESRKILASMVLRIGGALSIMLLGCTAGLGMALWAMASDVKIRPLEYNGQLDGDSYLILFLMAGIIICGLGWCFYRALRAAGQSDTEEQSAEIVRNT
ncbi:MAG TPA: hypothetical protein PLK08_02185, partial [Phycisphaerae bacterium]|nr:hypothetical protein [Phycisphaerae bacterium]